MAEVITSIGKAIVYNGTHGNASVQIAKATVAAEDGDTLVIAKLDVGVIPTRVKVVHGAMGAGSTLQAKLVPHDGSLSTINVTSAASAASAGAIDSETTNFMPTELEQTKYKLVLAVGGGDISGDITVKLETTSVGNL